MEDTQQHGNQGGNNTDEDSRKLFIGGLHTDATREDVRDYFAQYGAVEMCTIKTDVFTGRSRGFGFLIYADKESVEKVLNETTGHEIRGKTVDPKLATPQNNRMGGGGGGGRGGEDTSCKVFLGGLDHSTTKDDIKDAFDGFNGFDGNDEVVDICVPTDRATNESKGYAFVTFSKPEIATQLVDGKTFTVKGKECDVKRASSKGESQRGRGGFRGNRGNRGGYGGSYESGYGGGYNQGGFNHGYDQYSGGYQQGGYGGYQQQGGYGGYEQQPAWGSNYGQEQYKMKGGRGGRGGYQPY